MRGPPIHGKGSVPIDDNHNLYNVLRLFACLLSSPICLICSCMLLTLCETRIISWFDAVNVHMEMLVLSRTCHLPSVRITVPEHIALVMRHTQFLIF